MWVVAQDMALAKFQVVAGNHLGVALAVHATVLAHCPSRRLEDLSSGLLATLALSPLPIVEADADDPAGPLKDRTESLHVWTLGVFDPSEIGSSLCLPARVERR